MSVFETKKIHEISELKFLKSGEYKWYLISLILLTISAGAGLLVAWIVVNTLSKQ